jgi:hypothetical protein
MKAYFGGHLTYLNCRGFVVTNRPESVKGGALHRLFHTKLTESDEAACRLKIAIVIGCVQ